MGKLQQQQQQQQDAVYSGHNEPRAFLPLLGLPFPFLCPGTAADYRQASKVAQTKAPAPLPTSVSGLLVTWGH